jgi:hypothetical protein
MFERKHQDLHVKLRRDRDGRIDRARLVQHGSVDTFGTLELTKAQLYALVDDVAVADPEEWSRRFDPRGPIELALRRVADYFQRRVEANRDAEERASQLGSQLKFSAMANAFDQAKDAVQVEIETLYPDENK